MRAVLVSTVAVALAIAGSTFTTTEAQGDPDKVIPGGGVHVAGWTGKIDVSSERQGRVLNDAKFAQEGTNIHVTTGPAVTYWNPANRAAGDYTVKATFTEPKFQELSAHAHPYGIMIAGNDLGTDQQSYLYCAAYGTGTFIVRGFGPVPPPAAAGAPAGRGGPPTGAFQMNGGRGGADPIINKAAALGQPVTNEIAMSVRGANVECAINGKVVGTYPKAELVTAGRLKSTDGVYGLRFSHNVEAVIAGLGMTK